MKKVLLFVFIAFSFSACSLLSRFQDQAELVVDDDELADLISHSTDEVLKESWLSSFMASEGERPVVMMGQFATDLPLVFNWDKAYEYVDLELVKSGQVRVVKSNEIQRNTPPRTLAAGESVDFVFTGAFVQNKKEEDAVYFQLSVWNDVSNMPLASQKIKIQQKTSK